MFESTRSWASRKNLEHTHIHDQHTRALLDSQGRIHIQYPCPSRSTTLQRIPAGPTTFHQHLLHQLKRRRHSWHSKGPTTGKGIKVVLQKYPQGIYAKDYPGHPRRQHANFHLPLCNWEHQPKTCGVGLPFMEETQEVIGEEGMANAVAPPEAV